MSERKRDIVKYMAKERYCKIMDQLMLGEDEPTTKNEKEIHEKIKAMNKIQAEKRYNDKTFGDIK